MTGAWEHPRQRHSVEEVIGGNLGSGKRQADTGGKLLRLITETLHRPRERGPLRCGQISIDWQVRGATTGLSHAATPQRVYQLVSWYPLINVLFGSEV